MPNRKVTLREIQEAMRWRYEGTGLCPEEGGNKDTVRVVGVGRQSTCHALVLDAALPADRRCMMWVSLSNAEHAPFLPLNPAIVELADGYDAAEMHTGDRFCEAIPAAQTVSALSDQKDALRRRAFNEIEAEVSYAYDWKFASGWALNNQLGHIWDPGIGYESFDADAFTHEIHFVQRLSNPYLTPYYDVMYCYHPDPWIRVNTGLQRPFFFLDGRLCIMPKVFVTWGDSNRYEAKFNTKLDGGDVFGFRPMYVNSGIWSTYRLNDRLSFYLRLQMYDVLDDKGRDFENGRSESWAVCDMPFVVIGMTIRL